MPPTIRLIHATDRFAVIDKPPGVLSVPGKGPDKQVCAASMVAQMFPAASGPLIVHRLDMDTSGLMVFGLDHDAQRDLSAQFENRMVEKSYTAVVSGRVNANEGQIDAPMRLDVDRRPIQIIDQDLGRSAITRWRLLGFQHEGSRLLLTPVTGRTHQLRVHLAYIGHPIMGDVLYGPQPATAGLAERLLLHATSLSFFPPCEQLSTRRTPGTSASTQITAARLDFRSEAPF